MSGNGFNLMQMAPLLLIFVVFYFLLIRPQQKKMKTHQDMLGSLRRGDRVVTTGGIIGTVVRLTSDHEVMLEIAEGVRVRFVRSMISDVLAKTEPAASTKDEGANEEKIEKTKKTTATARKRTPANRQTEKA